MQNDVTTRYLIPPTEAASPPPGPDSEMPFLMEWQLSGKPRFLGSCMYFLLAPNILGGHSGPFS